MRSSEEPGGARRPQEQAGTGRNRQEPAGVRGQKRPKEPKLAHSRGHLRQAGKNGRNHSRKRGKNPQKSKKTKCEKVNVAEVRLCQKETFARKSVILRIIQEYDPVQNTLREGRGARACLTVKRVNGRDGRDGGTCLQACRTFCRCTLATGARTGHLPYTMHHPAHTERSGPLVTFEVWESACWCGYWAREAVRLRCRKRCCLRKSVF